MKRKRRNYLALMSVRKRELAIRRNVLTTTIMALEVLTTIIMALEVPRRRELATRQGVLTIIMALEVLRPVSEEQ